MVTTRGLTPESLAVALGKHFLLPGSDTVREAHDFWDSALEGQVPQTEEDLDFFLEELVDTYGGNLDDDSEHAQALARAGRVLGEFIGAADVEATIARYVEATIARYEPAETHADEVKRVRREWEADNPRGARAITWIWRGFWALSIVVLLVLLGFAIASGRIENVVVVVICISAIIGLLAAILAAVFSGIRKEPSSGEVEQLYFHYSD